MKKIHKALVNAWTYFWGTLLCFGIALLCFVWQITDELSLDLPIDPAVWGQYGDFVGGTVGIIFSLIGVVFVSRTFVQQKDVAESQQQLSNLQRFNDMCFELLRLYQEQEKELDYTTILPDQTIHQNYKDFFDGVSKAMSDGFVPSKSLSKNRKMAVDAYLQKTAFVSSKLSICYRTLFRMLDMIDSDAIDDEERRRYVKIIRAQLTYNELLCIRYHIRGGQYRRFAYLVNKYHIMKHLQMSELLEFSYWFKSEKLNDVEKMAVNRMFEKLGKGIRSGGSGLVGAQTDMLWVSYCVTPLKLEIIYHRNKTIAKTDYVSALFGFTDEELINLFQCYIKELVMFSNFSTFNNFRHLQFDNSIEHTDTEDKYITSARNRKNNRLFVAYDSQRMTLDNMQPQIF